MRAWLRSVAATVARQTPAYRAARLNRYSTMPEVAADGTEWLAGCVCGGRIGKPCPVCLPEAWAERAGWRAWRRWYAGGWALFVLPMVVLSVTVPVLNCWPWWLLVLPVASVVGLWIGRLAERAEQRAKARELTGTES